MFAVLALSPASARRRRASELERPLRTSASDVRLEASAVAAGRSNPKSAAHDFGGQGPR